MLQLSTTYLVATQDISRDNLPLPTTLTPAPEFLSSARFSKASPRGSVKTNSIPAGSAQLPFPSRSIPATSIPVPVEAARFPPSHSRADLYCTISYGYSRADRRGRQVEIHVADWCQRLTLKRWTETRPASHWNSMSTRREAAHCSRT